MTPQSAFMVLAPLIPARIADLKDLLAKMNLPNAPGMADPNNTLVPFGEFGTLHYARFVIVEDKTLGDFALLNLPVPQFDVSLAFLGDCDGPADDFLAALAENATASNGLRRIFGHCEDFYDETDLMGWMRERTCPAAVNYVNWIGRTVLQVHKEAALRRALQGELGTYVKAHPNAGDNVRGVRDHLVKFAVQHPEMMPARTSTPIGWCIRDFLHFAIVPFLLLLPWLLAVPYLLPPPPWFCWIAALFGALAFPVFLWLLRIAPWTFALLVALGLMLIPFFILFPLLLIPLLAGLLVFLLVLRWYEKTEPLVMPKPTREHDEALARHEDCDVSNQYSIIGCVKASAFRRALFAIALWLTNYGARHVYNRGNLARIMTIHFARWVMIDSKRRVFFASNYDGSHQAYMDDFINKVGWGLNIVFSNCFGYPRTNWLIKDGAENELRFKEGNRRHQIATEVWYKAYPGLTAFDLARNTRIREGLERRRMTDAAIRAWLRDL